MTHKQVQVTTSVEFFKTLIDVKPQAEVVARAAERILWGSLPCSRSELDGEIILAKSEALKPIFSCLLHELLDLKGYRLSDLIESLVECLEEDHAEKGQLIQVLLRASNAIADLERGGAESD